jgi:hypothetical protein
VLTTPLYYVNAPPHMGSAYTTIAADAVARFQASLSLPMHYRSVRTPWLVNLLEQNGSDSRWSAWSLPAALMFTRILLSVR